jgi:hypothetical protein
MTYRKEEYSESGIDVTIQQVRGPDSSHGASEPSAWLNGGAAYATHALEAYDFDVSDKEPFDKVKTVVDFMVDNRVRFCKKCDTFRDVDNFVSTGFAGRKCQACANKDNTCKDGDTHDDECVNPHQRHNARVATKYKCTKCGRTRKTTPTG